MRTHPAPAGRRTAARISILGLVVTLFLGVFALTGPAAQAAWTTSVQSHGAKAQVCKTSLRGGDIRIKVRLDNRRAKHTHVAKLFRMRGAKIKAHRDLRATKRHMSKAKSLVWSRAQRNAGEYLSVGFGEADGVRMGEDIPLRYIKGC